MQTPQDTIISTVTPNGVNHSDDIDTLLEGAEEARVQFDSTASPAIPVPVPQAARGRAVFTDPTDPKQIHAIAQRCKYHYVLSAELNAYVKLSRKEIIRVIKDLPSDLTYIKAQLSNTHGYDMLLIG